jgi:nucleoid-associated protein Lsr2
MAREVIEKLIDDLEGGDAAETVTFGLDGVSYEIDLSRKNAAALRKALERYITAARRRGGATRRNRRRDPARSPQGPGREEHRYRSTTGLRPRATSRVGRKQRHRRPVARPHPAGDRRAVQGGWRPLTQPPAPSTTRRSRTLQPAHPQGLFGQTRT